MISFEGQKKPELIGRIQQHEEVPRTLKGLFTTKELDEIREIQKLCFSRPELCSEKLTGIKKVPLGKMAHPDGELKQHLENLFRNKLKQHMSYDYAISFTFHRNYFPYGIHTDSAYDPQEFLYKQGIVPLEIHPADTPVYTVIFRQKCYHPISYPRRVETIRSLKSKERSVIFNYDTSQEIDSKDLKKYWDGEGAREWLKGFQIALPFEWKLGDMALWDRAHLHCSSDFEGHGVDGKLGLMWVSKRLA